MRHLAASGGHLNPAGQVHQTEERPPSDDLHQLLSAFDSYGLGDLDKANLMSRVDSKFVMPMSFLPKLLPELNQLYRVLDINNRRIFNYFNQYLDTKDMRFYHDHHNGKLNRYKVRYRTYVDTNTRFFEVKYKNNQKKTTKSRIQLHPQAVAAKKEQMFIRQQMAIALDQLVISQESGYKRIALADEISGERLTLDLGLWFQTDVGDEKMFLPGFFIAELKQKKHSKQSPFYSLMSKHHFRSQSFSKYCIGCALLYDKRLKANLFKVTLSRLGNYNQPYTPNSYAGN